MLLRSIDIRNLIEDDAYVARVFDIELPRAAKLRDMATSSIFFYLEPVLTNLEATTMIKDIPVEIYRELGYSELLTSEKSLSSVLDRFEALPVRFSEDDVWEVMNETLAALGLRKKAMLITPMRHALTGRKVGSESSC